MPRVQQAVLRFQRNRQIQEVLFACLFRDGRQIQCDYTLARLICSRINIRHAHRIRRQHTFRHNVRICRDVPPEFVLFRHISE